MDFRIIYPNDDGGVSIVTPIDSSLIIQQIIEKSVPAGKPYKIIPASQVPEDRTFRDAWEYQE